MLVRNVRSSCSSERSSSEGRCSWNAALLTRMELRSEPGEGSRFRLVLPAREA
jgi:hypothetical protein